MTIVELLDQLAEMRSALDVYRVSWETKRDEILTPVKTQLAELDAEFEPMIAEAQAKVSETEQAVKERVLAEGKTIKGVRLMAVWAKGRVSVDAKGLEGYAVAHPEVRQFITNGSPSVSIRTI